MSDFHSVISDQLTRNPSWQNRSWFECFLVVVILIVIAAVMVLRYQFVLFPVTLEELPAGEKPAEPLPAEDEAQQRESEEMPPNTATGPGAILLHLSELCQEFDTAAQDVRQYTGLREVQIQSWQRLCADILRRMLPVLENIEPYLLDEDERVSGLAQVIKGRLMTELLTVGVRELKPEPGEPFNASYHQLHPETTGLPPYQVQTVVAPGFLFRPRVSGANEVVLKPAEVIAESISVAEPSIVEEPIEITPADADEAKAIPEAALPEETRDSRQEEAPSAPATIAEQAAGAEELPTGGWDVLLLPLQPAGIDVDAEAEAVPELEESNAPPLFDEEDPLGFWLERDHKIWVVDDGNDVMHDRGEEDYDKG